MKPSSLFLASLALTASAAAQSPELSKFGGAAPGTTTLSLAGTPGELYVLVLGTSEAQTVLPSGATFDVSLDLLSLSFALPGFIGVLDGAGAAGASLALPASPALLGLTLSFQAASGAAVNKVSNLVRVTPQAPGTFAGALSDPTLPIVGGAVATQSDGLLQLVGGSGPLAQTYDPDREEFDLGGVTFGVGLLSQSTALADGRVLFTGGLGQDGQPTAVAAVYDPADGSTTELAMGAPRAGHGATLLGNGTVLVTGGFAALDLTDILGLFQGLLASSERFDPTTMSFSAGPAMLEPRALHTSAPLANGGALVAGGLTLIPFVNLPSVSATAYEFSPGLGTFGLPKFLPGARLAHSATLLDDGRVLLCGGVNIDLVTFLTSLDPLDITISTLDDCVTYKPGFFGGFSGAGTLSSPRAGAGMVALPGGRALVAGGFDLVLDPGDLLSSSFVAQDSADLFASGAVTPTGAMQSARMQPVLHVLDDGTVLVVGGGATGAEIYQP